MPKIFEGKISAEGYNFAVVSSRFNDFIGSKLADGCLCVGGRPPARG